MDYSKISCKKDKVKKDEKIDLPKINKYGICSTLLLNLIRYKSFFAFYILKEISLNLLLFNTVDQKIYKLLVRSQRQKVLRVVSGDVFSYTLKNICN